MAALLGSNVDAGLQIVTICSYLIDSKAFKEKIETISEPVQDELQAQNLAILQSQIQLNPESLSSANLIGQEDVSDELKNVIWLEVLPCLKQDFQSTADL